MHLLLYHMLVCRSVQTDSHFCAKLSKLENCPSDHRNLRGPHPPMPRFPKKLRPYGPGIITTTGLRESWWAVMSSLDGHFPDPKWGLSTNQTIIPLVKPKNGLICLGGSGIVWLGPLNSPWKTVFPELQVAFVPGHGKTAEKNMKWPMGPTYLDVPDRKLGSKIRISGP